MSTHHNKSFKLTFKNLKYSTESKIPFIKKSKKIILNGISGEFHGSELTAVIGLSGSGKSSLLDCLSGFSQQNVSGTISCNDKIISTQAIKEVSSYFMQEQDIHIFLTIKELMNFAVNMKCRQKFNKSEKNEKIDEILEILNILSLSDTLIRDLSGGERKRLQIAIELVDDPKILFLDEPTTNLDIVASTQCVQYLKDITRQGRAVICTIHQPSSSMLHLFDHIYALRNGNCIYQGSSQNLLKFFNDLELSCPSMYNPADFLIELANEEYGSHNHLLTEKIENGANSSYRNEHEVTNPVNIFMKTSNNNEHTSTYFHQLYYLLLRLLITAFRNNSLIYVRFGLHILIGIFLGLVYEKVGHDATYIIDNYHFVMVTLCLVIYTSFHSNYVTFPLDFPIVKREFFNGWYTVKAYYSSIILFDVPIIFISVTLVISIAYLLTNQPLEMNRYLVLLGFSLMISYAGQALAIMITSLLTVQLSLLLGTYFLLTFFIFSLYCAFERDTVPIFRPVFKLNFIHMGVKGAVNSILGLNRTKLECSDMYCHFSDPKKFMQDFECEVDLMEVLYLLVAYIVVCQTVAFILINYRLKYRRK